MGEIESEDDEGINNHRKEAGKKRGWKRYGNKLAGKSWREGGWR